MKFKFYSFFTKYSLLEDYGFIGGFTSRLFRKFIPKIAEEDTFEFYLKRYQFRKADYTVATDVLRALLAKPESKESISKDLDKAIIALSSKIISYGLDHEFQAHFERLNIDSKCYEKLINQISSLLEKEEVTTLALHKNLDEIYQSIILLRKNKKVIGTSLHLTVSTKTILDCINRIKDLLDLKNDLGNIAKWEEFIIDFVDYDKSQNSLRNYIGSHIDLLALEVVEHTSQKGEGYIASNKKEYKKFFKKGLLGGAIIAIFALFKIIIDANISTTIPRAFMYSLNYASCFVLVKFLGGTIATKQPAMTASTITKHIDKNDDLVLDAIQDIIILLRKVARSQFISLAGNFLMAFSVACLIGILLKLGFTENPIDTEKSTYLIKKAFPISGGGILYAAVAGVFLALSGFISGYFDNWVVASKLPYRVRHNRFISRFTTKNFRKRISNSIEKSLGVMAGNVSLGFFLGSAFLLSYFLPFNVDIRHIAFSSANIGYGLMNYSFDIAIIIFAILSVFIIGLVNFLVSFLITFVLALKSRSITPKEIRQLISLSIKDIFKNPLDYLIIRDNDSLEAKSDTI